jgi:hypothetical protein
MKSLLTLVSQQMLTIYKNIKAICDAIGNPDSLII